MSELKPCPFCGEPPESGDGFLPCESIVYVWCNNTDCVLCGVDVETFTPETWNERADD